MRGVKKLISENNQHVYDELYRCDLVNFQEELQNT